MRAAVIVNLFFIIMVVNIVDAGEEQDSKEEPSFQGNIKIFVKNRELTRRPFQEHIIIKTTDSLHYQLKKIAQHQFEWLNNNQQLSNENKTKKFKKVPKKVFDMIIVSEVLNNDYLPEELQNSPSRCAKSQQIYQRPHELWVKSTLKKLYFEKLAQYCEIKKYHKLKNTAQQLALKCEVNIKDEHLNFSIYQAKKNKKKNAACFCCLGTIIGFALGGLSYYFIINKLIL